MTTEYYTDQFYVEPAHDLDCNGKLICEGWIDGVDLVEDGIKVHNKARELDPYENYNVVLCRDHQLMDRRTYLVDTAITNCLRNARNQL